MKIFYEQFEEEVRAAVDKHVSLDPSLVPEDMEWELGNLTKRLAAKLRQYGVNIVDD